MATTVASIALEAGVSPATIYKSYGGKAGLARALCEQAYFGEGSVHAHERSNALRSATDARAVIAGWAGLATEVSPRLSPLLTLLQVAAQSDPEAAALHDELEADRLARMTDNARFLARAGFLRDGVSTREARDVLWTCTSAEIFDLLVTRRRWSHQRFGRFLTDTIVGSLL